MATDLAGRQLRAAIAAAGRGRTAPVSLAWTRAEAAALAARAHEGIEIGEEFGLVDDAPADRLHVHGVARPVTLPARRRRARLIKLHGILRDPLEEAFGTDGQDGGRRAPEGSARGYGFAGAISGARLVFETDDSQRRTGRS